MVDDDAIGQLLDGECAVIGTDPRIDQANIIGLAIGDGQPGPLHACKPGYAIWTCGLFIELHGGLQLQGLGLDEGDRVTSVIVAMIGGIKLAAIA